MKHLFVDAIRNQMKRQKKTSNYVVFNLGDMANNFVVGQEARLSVLGAVQSKDFSGNVQFEIKSLLNLEANKPTLVKPDISPTG